MDAENCTVVKLMQLEIREFMGIERFHMAPNGKNMSVCGYNKAGKTTIASAITWLLADKDLSLNQPANFSIKPMDTAGNIIEGKTPYVTVKFSVNGDPLTLGKGYYEKRTKRGKLTGHTARYSVNDEANVKKKDFDKAIAEIGSVKTLQLLMSPFFFNTLPQAECRKILFEVGNVKAGDELVRAEKKRTQLKAELSVVERETIAIKPVIKELRSNAGTLSPHDAETATNQLVKIDKKIAAINAGLVDPDVTRKISKLEDEIKTLEFDESTDIIRKKTLAKLAVEALEGKLRNEKMDIIGALETAGRKALLAESIEEEIADCRTMFGALIAEPEPNHGICPTCHQPITDKKSMEAAVSAFKEDRAKRATEINVRGKDLTGKLSAIREDMKKLAIGREVHEKNEASFNTELEIAQTKLDSLSDPTTDEKPDGSNTDALKKELSDLIESSAITEDTKVLLEEVNAERTKTSDIISACKEAVKSVKRIDVLKKKEKDGWKKVEKIEDDITKIEEEVRAEAEKLEGPINAMFERCSFKFMEDKISSGFKPCCVTVVNGVQWGHGLNTEGEVSAGLDIVRVLSKHYGISMPCLVDNAESVLDFADPDMQLIRFYADKNCEQLEVFFD